MSADPFTEAAEEFARQEVLTLDTDHIPPERPLSRQERAFVLRGAAWARTHLAASVTALHAADADGNCTNCTRGRLYPIPAPCDTVRAIEGGEDR